MMLVICPGVHEPALTYSFLAGLQASCAGKGFQNSTAAATVGQSTHLRIFPAQELPPYSPFHVLQFLQQHCALDVPLILIGFSAGGVGAMGAAWGWQQQGGIIKALIAVDGWGVPVLGDFPVHRLSHDRFTQWSSGWLGAGETSFYAEPAVEHLNLWGSPQTTWGWCVVEHQRRRTTAAEFTNLLLSQHGWQGSSLDQL